jgi:hypothetical protein
VLGDSWNFEWWRISMEHVPRFAGRYKSGFHAETSELVTPKDKSGLAEDHVAADRGIGWRWRIPGMLPLSIQDDHGA